MKLNLLQRYREWRWNRRWPAKKQLERLQIQLEQDILWMAHDPKVVALCKRYADMLASDWMDRPVENVITFWRSISNLHSTKPKPPLSRVVRENHIPSRPNDKYNISQDAS